MNDLRGDQKRLQHGRRIEQTVVCGFKEFMHVTGMTMLQRNGDCKWPSRDDPT